MKPERVYKWDNLKFTLIVLVIIGHVADLFYSYNWCRTLFLAIYLFHMPAFFFVSGLFSKKTVNADRLDPMKVVPLLTVSMLLNFFSYYPGFLATGEGTYYFILRNNISWYLFAYAVFLVLAWALRKVRHSYVLILSLFLALVAGLDETVGAYLAVSRIISFFPVFYAGYMLDEKKLSASLDRAAVKVCSAAVLAGYLAFMYFKTDALVNYGGIITGNMNYVEVLGSSYLKGIPARVFFYIIMAAVILALCSLAPSRRIPFVSYAGSNTLPVYFFHLPVLKLLLLYEPFKHLFTQGGKTGLISAVGASIIMTVIFTLPPFVKFMDILINPRPAVPASPGTEKRKKLWVYH